MLDDKTLPSFIVLPSLHPAGDPRFGKHWFQDAGPYFEDFDEKSALKSPGYADKKRVVQRPKFAAPDDYDDDDDDDDDDDSHPLHSAPNGNPQRAQDCDAAYWDARMREDSLAFLKMFTQRMSGGGGGGAGARDYNHDFHSPQNLYPDGH